MPGKHPVLSSRHLVDPMLDDRTCGRYDPHPFTGEFFWTRHNNAFDVFTESRIALNARRDSREALGRALHPSPR